MADSAYIACIDAGTTGCRTIIFSIEGQLVTQTYEEYTSIFLSPTWIDHDPSTWIQAAHNTLKQAVAQFPGDPKEIAAICVISQRATFVLVDQEGQPLDHAILWQDKRATREAEMIRDQMGPDVVYRKTGLRIDPYFSLPKLLWVKAHKPQLFKKAHKMLAVHDLLLNYLSGEFVTDWTQASRAMLFNIRTFEWDAELCEAFEIPMELLPKAVAPGSIVGTLKRPLYAEFNLPANIPIVAVGGDQQAAAVGLGVVAPGLMCVNTGTGSFILAHAERPAFDEQQRVVCTASAVAGKWLVEASIFTSGAVYRWFRDNFALLERKTAQELDIDAYDILNNEMKHTGIGAEGIFMIPHFAGSAAPYWDPDAAGVLFGLSLGHTRSHVIRALLEGVCFEIHKNIRIIESLTNEMTEIRVSGGATRSAHFNQMQADVYGKTVLRGASEQSSALGAMLVAAVGIGIYPDISTAVKQVLVFDDHDRKISDQQAHQIYETMAELHHEIYLALSSRNIYERVRTLRERLRS